MDSVIQIPTISVASSGIPSLASIWQQGTSTTADVVFDFSECEALAPYAAAFIGGLAKWIKHRGRNATFDWVSVRYGLFRQLQQIQFTSAFGIAKPLWRENMIPFRQDLALNKEELVRYLLSNLTISTPSRNTMNQIDYATGILWEAYQNVFDHASSPIGVFTCGSHHSKPSRTTISVIDFGKGIPNTVRDFRKLPGLSPDEAMRWAFEEGKTTKPIEAKRGLGLQVMREFVLQCNGRLEIYSHDGYASIRKRGDLFSSLPSFFEATMVNLSIDLYQDNRQLYFANLGPNEE